MRGEREKLGWPEIKRGLWALLIGGWDFGDYFYSLPAFGRPKMVEDDGVMEFGIDPNGFWKWLIFVAVLAVFFYYWP